MHAYARSSAPSQFTNPLREARRLSGLTQVDLAVLAQVTRHTVLRAEQGLYIQPPTAIVRALGLPLVTTVEEYRRWIKHERRSHSHKFEYATSYFNNFGCTFEDYRLRVHKSVSGFAKIICYPISLIERYETTGSNAESLQIAFDECNIGIQLGEFDTCD